MDLSFLVHGDFEAPIEGLEETPREDWPNVHLVFQTYHGMLTIGVFFLANSVLTLLVLYQDRIFSIRPGCGCTSFAILPAYLGNQLGWVSAEAGRQPWIVWNQLRTSDALSEAVTAEMVLSSIIMFGLVYALLVCGVVVRVEQQDPARPRGSRPAASREGGVAHRRGRGRPEGTLMDWALLWFVLLGVLLTGYAILDGFDLGVGMLHIFVTDDDTERRLVINSIGPLWDGNEVWLVTFGGALFAAFPEAYATVFSGFYIPFMMLLVTLIFRAAAIEFRSKVHEPRWRRVRGTIAFTGASFGDDSFLMGVAVGNLVWGVPMEDHVIRIVGARPSCNPYAIGVGLLAVPRCSPCTGASTCT